MSFRQDQSFNNWNKMLGEIYDKTQNYSKSSYEIHCHLTEVTGGFGKYFIKKREFDEAKSFLTSIFAWTLALIRKVTDNQNEVVAVDRIIFTKFPGACPYCLNSSCSCTSQKSTENYTKARELAWSFLKKNETSPARVKHIQQMFNDIYSHTWNKYGEINKNSSKIKFSDKKEIAHYNISFLYSRMMEELAEIAEAIRFYHLYRSNFENEVADRLCCNIYAR